jgi:hypothetical protein
MSRIFYEVSQGSKEQEVKDRDRKSEVGDQPRKEAWGKEQGAGSMELDV